MQIGSAKSCIAGTLPSFEKRGRTMHFPASLWLKHRRSSIEILCFPQHTNSTHNRVGPRILSSVGFYHCTSTFGESQIISQNMQKSSLAGSLPMNSEIPGSINQLPSLGFRANSYQRPRALFCSACWTGPSCSMLQYWGLTSANWNKILSLTCATNGRHFSPQNSKQIFAVPKLPLGILILRLSQYLLEISWNIDVV